MKRQDLKADHCNGLLLTGGGARAAYQAGVLEAIADIRKACGVTQGASPFQVITGTSAGAINAAALAVGADDFDGAVRRLADVWRNFHADQVYRSDVLGVMRAGARWLSLLSVGWVLAQWWRLRPRSLLDNAPLHDLLRGLIPLQRLPNLIRRGHLQALSVSASSYSSGQHVDFYQGSANLQPWRRSQRYAVRDRITHEHLLASAAIPFIFPATPLTMDQGRIEYFGDGSMRKSAPIAPAIHLGAQRIVVVGAGRMNEPDAQISAYTSSGYPSLAQIAGHAMSSIFLDGLSVDVERVQRINRTLALVPEQALDGSALRPVQLLVISPSQRLDAIAARHVGALPVMIRALLAALGVSAEPSQAREAALASYLLFEAPYTQELMALGYADTCAQQDELRRFFGWPEPRTTVAPPQLARAA